MRRVILLLHTQTFQKPGPTPAQTHLRVLDDLDIETTPAQDHLHALDDLDVTVKNNDFVLDGIEEEVDYDMELSQILIEAPAAPKLISVNFSASQRAS